MSHFFFLVLNIQIRHLTINLLLSMLLNVWFNALFLQNLKILSKTSKIIEFSKNLPAPVALHCRKLSLVLRQSYRPRVSIVVLGLILVVGGLIVAV